MPSSRRTLIQRTLQVALVAAAAWHGLAPHASAQVVVTSAKVSTDLRSVLAAPPGSAPAVPWARVLGSEMHVRVLINAQGSDATLAALRQDVVGRGGSVHYNYMSVRALSALVPASAVPALAARGDVLGISPNRSTARHAKATRRLASDTVASASTTLTAAVTSVAAATGLDGRGVGIAVLDSGIDWRHKHFLDATGQTRVRQVVDIVGIGRMTGQLWLKGIDLSELTRAYLSSPLLALDKALTTPFSTAPDLYGHGTHVASVAAGAGGYQTPEASGVAPAADLYDVRVLDERGIGNVADALAGIDWVVQRARMNNIRVMNLSLGAASTDSFLLDPLARAARGAVASGVVVVAAAGNAGRNDAGQVVFGTIASPGHEPSVITVGSANDFRSPWRSDDAVNGFSSRGPTRGSFALPSGKRWIDNLVKPDLVAHGNRIVGAGATHHSSTTATTQWNLLATLNPKLTQIPGAAQSVGSTLMELSGTSVAAPQVAGAVALMLQANPGLTPPLVKAMLQYSAQPLPAGGLIVQGTGLLNAEGAIALARSLRTDIAGALAAGRLRPGENLLASGRTLPTPSTTIAGQSVPWSRLITAGGTRLLTGDALFTKWQPIYDPALTWARPVVLRSQVQYFPASTTVPANTVVSAVIESNAARQPLVGAGVRVLDVLAGSKLAASSWLLTPVPTLAGYAAGKSGLTLKLGFEGGQGIVAAEGLRLSEGFLLADGFLLAEGFLLSEGFLLAEGFMLSEGFLLAEGFMLSEGFLLAEGFLLSEGFLLAEGFLLSESTAADPAGMVDKRFLGE